MNGILDSPDRSSLIFDTGFDNFPISHWLRDVKNSQRKGDEKEYGRVSQDKTCNGYCYTAKEGRE